MVWIMKHPKTKHERIEKIATVTFGPSKASHNF
jgi:hypothetical protein